jgi:hypothetical protein
MIEKIKVNSRTTEIHGSARTINTSYQQSGLTADLFLMGIFSPLAVKTDELGVAIDRSHSESILADKDGERDGGVRAVGYLVTGYLYYPKQTVRDAAGIVKKVFDKYGFSVTEESYVTESSHLVSMLGDLAAPEVVVAIALLKGVDENIAALQAAQDGFETTRAKFAKDEAKEDTYASATVLKKEVVTLINDDLVQFLRTGERFQPDMYGAFARTIAKIIANNNEQVKKRSKKDEPVD